MRPSGKASVYSGALENLEIGEIETELFSIGAVRHPSRRHPHPSLHPFPHPLYIANRIRSTLGIPVIRPRLASSVLSRESARIRHGDLFRATNREGSSPDIASGSDVRSRAQEGSRLRGKCIRPRFLSPSPFLALLDARDIVCPALHMYALLKGSSHFIHSHEERLARANSCHPIARATKKFDTFVERAKIIASIDLFSLVSSDVSI